VHNPLAGFKIMWCTYGMRTYSQIFTDFCNTTRLRFRTFWHGLKIKAEERRSRQEEHLKRFTQKIFDYFLK